MVKFYPFTDQDTNPSSLFNTYKLHPLWTKQLSRTLTVDPKPLCVFSTFCCIRDERFFHDVFDSIQHNRLYTSGLVFTISEVTLDDDSRVGTS